MKFKAMVEVSAWCGMQVEADGMPLWLDGCRPCCGLGREKFGGDST